MFFSGIWDFLSSGSNWTGPDGIPTRTLEHLKYTGMAVGIAAVIGLPVGLFIGHTGRGRFVISVANSLRALPSYGLLVFFIVWISPHIHGKGDLAYLLPSLIVFTLLAIPAIMSNTFAGIENVDPQVRDAARGMGMRGGQVLWRVEFPVALPLIISGFRNATLQVIATGTIAAQVSLGGLGQYIITGLGEGNVYGLMIPGGVLVAALALLIDLCWALFARLAVSRGLSGRSNRMNSRVTVGAAARTLLRREPASGAAT